MKLDTIQATVLAYLFDRLALGDDVGTLEFSLAGSFVGKFNAVHSQVDLNGKTGHFVATLPRYSSSVFVAMTVRPPNETARVLANLEDYERERGLHLHLGDSVLTAEHTDASTETLYAVLLLRTATSKFCEGLQDAAVLNGRKTSFFFVMPLTRVEWEMRRDRGHDALLDEFEQTDKQIYFL